MADAQSNIALAKSLGLDITWATLTAKTASQSTVDFSKGEPIPETVVGPNAPFKTARGFGKRVKRDTEGRLMVRTNPADGRAYLIPVE